MQILTHRGLEPSKADYFSESTLEAFNDQLERGFGIEVDLNFTTDGIVLCHDADLKRMTQGRDTRLLKLLTNEEACKISLRKGRLGTFDEVMQAVRRLPGRMIALHLKGAFQTSVHCDTLIAHLKSYSDIGEQILIFDATPKAATYLKKALPWANLAASVAHPYDIERFQAATKGTLISLDDFLQLNGLFSWAWLDEWDLTDKRPDGTINRRGKMLYTAEVFDAVRNHGCKVALVTPELHGTSPGLLGGEAHPHASTPERLFARIEEIVALQPDALCTDYPEEVRALARLQRADCR